MVRWRNVVSQRTKTKSGHFFRVLQFSESAVDSCDLEIPRREKIMSLGRGVVERLILETTTTRVANFPC